jgi:hypothetical protein
MTVRHLRNVSRDPGDYFVMISVNDRDLKFATEVQTSQDHSPDLVWDESFDLAITRLSTVAVLIEVLRGLRSKFRLLYSELFCFVSARLVW